MENEIKQKDWSLISGQVSTVSYDEKTKLLTIVFKNRGVYSYSDVPLEVWEASLNASSIGKFINQSIKPIYKFKKLI